MSQSAAGALSATLLLLLAHGAAAETRYVRVSWDDPDTAHTVAVTWNSDAVGDPSMVEYGPTTGYGATAQGTATQAPGGLGAVHEVGLVELNADTLYHFRVGGPGNWSVDHTFRTAPDDVCTPFRFVAAGDGRSDFEIGASLYWNPILSEMLAQDPAFVLLTGDQVKSGEETEQWDDFLDKSYGNGPSVPLMMTLGNHDAAGPEGDAANYNQLFTFPRNVSSNTEDFYYFTYGDAIFVSLSTDTFKGGAVPFQQQADWLDQVLTDNPRSWKFVFFHHPIYTGGIGIPDLFEMVSHPPNEKGQNGALVPIFDKHHVDVVLTGHNHFYQRFKPMCCGGGDDSGVVVDDFADGTVYVVTGGAGALTYDTTIIGIDLSWVLCLYEGSEICNGRHHYVVVDIDQNTLHYQVWTTAPQLLSNDPANVELIDELSIVKGDPPPACAVASPDAAPDTGGPGPDESGTGDTAAEDVGPTVPDAPPVEPSPDAPSSESAPDVPASADADIGTPPTPDVPTPEDDPGTTPPSDTNGGTPATDSGSPPGAESGQTGTNTTGGTESDGCTAPPSNRALLFVLLAVGLFAVATRRRS